MPALHVCRCLASWLAWVVQVVIPTREEDALAALHSISEYNATAFVASASSLAEAPSLDAFNLSSLRTGLLGACVGGCVRGCAWVCVCVFVCACVSCVRA